MALEVIQLPVLSDNYVYLIRDQSTGRVGVVDPALAPPVLKALAERGWQLDYILNTHHHHDHVGGNKALQAETGCEIIGPRADDKRIPGIQRRVATGDRVAVGVVEPIGCHGFPLGSS